jgi:hypothetical protein
LDDRDPTGSAEAASRSDDGTLFRSSPEDWRAVRTWN